MAAFVTGSGGAGRPLRIVLVVGSLRIGGTETQLVKLAADLRERGHDVHVVAISRGGPLESELRSQGTPARIFAHSGLRLRDDAGWRSPRALLGEARELLAIWRHLRSLRADVCHAFGFTCYTLVLPLALAAGVPVRVNGRRGMPPATPTGLQRRLRDLLGHRCSSVYVCNSHAGARDLQAREGVPAGRIVVIPNGVGIPPAVAEAGRQPARGVVVANLISYKGHADLVEALGMLAAPPEMCFIGEGPERERLTALVEERGLERVVAFAGTVPVAVRLLRHYQFAVLPSHEEGLPNAVLEAMAAGLPVIATAVGGTPEIVVDGVTGLLVPAHAPDELASAIARLTADPRLREEMGAAGRRAAEHLSIGSCAARHEAVYRTAPR
ncbi:glycosyltransferase [Actinomadura scrupuli]|uniref:glycosyltransferase n=1 Tax=Actinomadura scrupuli TaxID=559629 RepID=UPI003D956A5A